MDGYKLAVEAMNERLRELDAEEYIGDPALRPLLVRELSWQQRWVSEHRKPFVEALYAAAGESAADFFIRQSR